MSLSIDTVLSLLETYPYLLLFPLVLLEGPITTVAAGLFVATGLMDWPIAYAIAVTADLAGDSIYYTLGRGARRPGIGSLPARLGLTPERLAAMEASFSGKAGGAILGAKVLDAAAVPVFVAAGFTKVSYWLFLGWTAAATVPKAALLMAFGFFAGGQALDLIQRLDPGPIVPLVLLTLAAITILFVSKKVCGQATAYAKQTTVTTIKEENR